MSDRRIRAALAVSFGVVLAYLPIDSQSRDPGINQPGAMGNRGVGAPGVGVVDPGLNQPGVAGNVGGIARRSVRL